MKRFVHVFLAVALIVSAGCRTQHPSLIKIEPEFDASNVTTIVLTPMISVITKGEDPQRDSERIPNKILWDYLSERTDYRFLSAEQFNVAIYKENLSGKLEDFNNNWNKNHVADQEFLLAAKKVLQADLVLIPVVYLWYKDEADYREQGSASVTQVGMTISLVDTSTGKVLWECTDENYKEAVRTEGERALVSSAGIDRRVAGRTAMGKDMYAAPPYEDVCMLVIQAIVNAIPEKSTSF